MQTTRDGWKKSRSLRNSRFNSAVWEEFLTQLALLTNVEAEDDDAGKR